jgi:hypothetical protein
MRSTTLFEKRQAPSPPFDAAVEVLLVVFDVVRVAAEQAGDQAVFQVARDHKLAAVLAAWRLGGCVPA